MEYGLLGKELSYSFSKDIHEMLGAYSYQLLPTAPEDLPSFMEARDFLGLNVTIPYKREVIPYLDVLDETAAGIGAVNTIYFRDGKMHGTNTDYTGFLFMADRCGIDFSGRCVLICGTGGASLMAQKAVADRGAAEVLVAGRKGPLTYDRLPRGVDIIVNTTPLGTYPGNGRQAVDLTRFDHPQGVLDLIYNPQKSALLLQAEEMGLRFSGGLPMLVAQATAAAGYFTGEDIYQRENERIIKALQDRQRNIVLVGMPGSGKTTIGRELASALSLKFVDTDEVLAARAGKPAGRVIEDSGEEYFRGLESEIIRSCTAEHGQVIATGGGAVLRQENRRAMRQNGPVIFIERDITQLPTEGRPLSRDLEEMYQKRLPLYHSCSDFTLANNGPLNDSIQKILATLSSRESNI
ncbi:MAG: shikimate kinase [Anaerovoracaceae bacterium]|jgi:shikimate dehydrogenase